MRRVLTGVAVAPGMALGRARRVQPRRYSADMRPLDAAEAEAEIARLEAALAHARTEIAEVRGRLQGVLKREAEPFLDAHALLLDDPELHAGLLTMIRTGRYRADAALIAQRDRLGALFGAMADPYLRSRREDFDQVIGRVLAALERDTSVEERRLAARVGDILVAESPTPAEVAALAGHGLLGVLASSGSAYSHSAILARSLRLPMLTGVHEALDAVRDDDLVLLDGEHGEAVLHPAAQDLARYRQWQRDAARDEQRRAGFAHAPSRSRDGVRIQLHANAERSAEIAQAHACGADGVGLYRTEFLFLRRAELPDEDEQFEAYRELVLGMGGCTVTVRTLDIGADKADGSGLALAAEPNPALGVRGLRLSLRQPAVFRTQLRAMLRAAALGPLRILLPMVTTAAELRAARAHVDACAETLRTEGHATPDAVAVGAMIEVPAAALCARALLAEADFAAIGTNDLAQYVLAADRGNDALGELYDPLHPALLRLIAHVVAAGRRAGRPVSLCGEIAGEPAQLPLLLALGLTELSMHPARLLAVRERLAALDVGALRTLAPRLVRAADREAVTALLPRG